MPVHDECEQQELDEAREGGGERRALEAEQLDEQSVEADVEQEGDQRDDGRRSHHVLHEGMRGHALGVYVGGRGAFQPRPTKHTVIPPTLLYCLKGMHLPRVCTCS